MKISEMSLEELQDYALKLQDENTAKDAKIADLTGEKTDLMEMNVKLQKRNNELFMRVEQGSGTDDGKGEGEQPEEPKSYEKLTNTLKGVIIK